MTLAIINQETMNPFATAYQSDEKDASLIAEILNGDQQSLNVLVKKHQPFIYNIAWKMIGDPVKAEDLTQEALIKIISHLASFKENSSFRTWAYRIVRNHFLNDQKRPNNLFADNFEDLGSMLDASPSVDISAEEQELKKEEIREVRLQCLSGMLLCLNKEQRLIYIIGDIFGGDHKVGAEMMEVSPANFRKKLSDARRQLHNFMLNKCGLVNKANPCRCHKKVTVAMEQGMVDAKDLLFNQKAFSTFKKSLELDANYLVEEAEHLYTELHRDHSYKTTFDKKNFIEIILESPNWRDRLNLN